jgi:hypothetical protein
VNAVKGVQFIHPMTDVFISYAREDREAASELASVLGAKGWSVWWDRNVITGQAFDHAIEHALDQAKCVVVLWSKASVASEWVKNEASAAVERGVLVPALIEKVKLPLEFRRKQTADLIGWDGDPQHPGFQEVCQGVAHVTGTLTQHSPGAAPPAPRRWSRSWTYGAIAAIAMAVLLVAYFQLAGPSKRPISPTENGRRQPVKKVPAPTPPHPPGEKMQTASAGTTSASPRPNEPSGRPTVNPQPVTPSGGTQTPSVIVPKQLPAVLKPASAPPVVKPNAYYKVGLQTLGVPDDEFQRLHQAILSRGFQQDVQSAAWHEDMTWLAKTSTVLYYERANSQKAKDVAGLMRQLTGVTFVTARGSGHGIDRREHSIHLVIHYIKPKASRSSR